MNLLPVYNFRLYNFRLCVRIIWYYHVIWSCDLCSLFNKGKVQYKQHRRRSCHIKAKCREISAGILLLPVQDHLTLFQNTNLILIKILLVRHQEIHQQLVLVLRNGTNFMANQVAPPDMVILDILQRKLEKIQKKMIQRVVSLKNAAYSQNKRQIFFAHGFSKI